MTSTMSKAWVLKIPCSHDEGYVLLQASSSSDLALDLNLLATEGDAPYKGKIRQRKTADLRAKNFPGSDHEWQNILCHVFNPQAAPALSEDQRKGLEVVATIGNGKVIVSLRNRVDKITQKLGSIELTQDESVEIQLFEWCGSAIDQKSILEFEHSVLRRKYESAQATIASLDAKLEELVKAKTDHEEELISKFVLLLNEKKLKIRNQQRLLSTAKVDQKRLQEMQKTLEGKGRRAGSSRAGKRRIHDQAGAAEMPEDSSDAFEKMDVDQQEGIVAGSQEASSERQTTPETETDADSDGVAAKPLPEASPASKTSSPARNKASKKAISPAPKRGNLRQSGTKSASPPPPARKLPFARKGAKAKKTPGPETEPVKQAQVDTRDTANVQDSGGDETASDDDEL